MTATVETLVRRFYHDLWNRFDATLIPVLLTEDVTVRSALGRHAAGHAAFADYLELVRGAFPDFEQTIDQIEVDGVGGSAFVRLRCRGTHRGLLFGCPATGRRVAYEGAVRFATRDGRIADIWLLGDVHGLVRQLGTEREQDGVQAKGEEKKGAASTLRDGALPKLAPGLKNRGSRGVN